MAETWDQVGPQPYYVPGGQWVTLGFMHDGLGTVELYAGGQVVARRTGTYGPIDPPGPVGLNFGNNRILGDSLRGEIDDVKIWRLNPQRFDNNYFGRPLDPKTAECWKRFWRDVDAASKQNAQCAGELVADLSALIRGFVGQTLAQGPETKAQLLKTAREYDELWHRDDIGGAAMAKVFSRLIAWLHLVGDPRANRDLLFLLESDCMKSLLAGIKPPDCDAKAVSMLQSIVNSLNATGGV
jgi:Concanavalin A-like lectin/glucanases superfamily